MISYPTRRPDIQRVRSTLPETRGPITERLFSSLCKDPHNLHWAPDVESASDDDLHLALYCCYELHYRGWCGVDADWEWEPSLLRARRLLEQRFEANLRTLVGPVETHPELVIAELWRLASSGDGRSLSGWVAARGTLDHVKELAKHRSAYQLKEADPHTWAIPRLGGDAKAVMVAIQTDEYGNGVGAHMHSSLFAENMESLGLDTTPNAYVDELPGFTLATTNVISFFGLHRRLRGALVGHLALFEMTSIGPMSRYAQALRRLGVPPGGRRFYEVHVEADELHQHLATDGMVAGLLRQEPQLAADVVFGARALSLTEQRFTAQLLSCWESGHPSLRIPQRTAAVPSAHGCHS